jgi:hypothetical protein
VIRLNSRDDCHPGPITLIFSRSRLRGCFGAVVICSNSGYITVGLFRNASNGTISGTCGVKLSG